MAAPLYTTASGLYFHAGKILVLTVGLPARGKTHMSRALERYLRWMGIKTTAVSLGDYRRRTLGSAEGLPPDYFTLGKKSPETEALRKTITEGGEQSVWDCFTEGYQIVIYDANNGTKARRQNIAQKFSDRGIHVILLESWCDNKDIIERNIRSVKIGSPDYKDWDPEKAVEDYWSRIRDHQKYYETINDSETNWPYIRIINVGEKIETNKIHGYLQSRIVFFLMNMHNRFRTIYFARSGHSLIEHSYKADSDLSLDGWEYAERLKEFVLDRRNKTLKARGIETEGRKLVIWTSARRRSYHTAWPFIKPKPTRSISLTAPSRPSTPRLARQSLDLGKQPPSRLKDSNRPAVEEAIQEQDEPSPPSTPEIEEEILDSEPLESANPLVKVIEKPQMSEINPGIWDGLGLEEVRERYPDEWTQFVHDPYSFRARRAESYHDLSVRLEQTIIEIERQQEDLLIIGHASVIRCLWAYLIGLPATEVPSVEVARGDLIEVIPASYGVISHAYHFWDGPGRKMKDKDNFYENYAEETVGKKIVMETEDAVA